MKDMHPDQATAGVSPHPAAPSAAPVPKLKAGTPGFRHAVAAIAASGFGTFLMLYCTQPILPVFSGVFGASPAVSSLSVSFATGALAPMLIVTSFVSDRLGRKWIIVSSLIASGLLTAAAALADSFTTILVLRLLAGITMSGMPAIAMAYLAEECEARSIALVTGVLIGANAFGGMSGRLMAGTLTDFASWRWAIAVTGLTGTVLGIAAWGLMPPSRHFKPRSIAPSALLRSFRAQFTDRGLLILFFLAFVLMGGFVTIYNYSSYRLLAPEFGLSQTAAGAIFSLYLVGIAASLAMARAASAMGQARALNVSILIMLAGVLLTMSTSLAAVIFGIAAVTFGFFGAHTIASSWLTLRARGSRAQAAAIYMFCYYVGSSGIGTMGGIAWASRGWTAVALLVSALVLAALGAAYLLSREEAGEPPAAGRA